MSEEPLDRTKFTPKLLNAALEKYVLKTKYTDKDKEYILKRPKNFDDKKTLEYLIENSEGRLDIYAPAEELWKNLKILTSFPDNSKFLGVFGDRMNFEQLFYIHRTKEKKEFLMKADLPLFLYHNFKMMCENDDITLLFLETFGNKLYRNLKNRIEYVPKEKVTETHQFCCDIWQTTLVYYHSGCKEKGFDFIEYDSEEVFSCLSEFYDKDTDEEFLQDLRKQIEITVKVKPIKSNEKYYQKVLRNHQLLANTLNQTTANFPFIFQLFNPEINDFPHYPVVRMLDYMGKKFVFAKELELALRNVEIDVETEEDRKNGIIRTVEYDEFLSILKKAGMEEKDLNIVPEVIHLTMHEICPPTYTAYGTHCKMAIHVFHEIFRIFTIDLRMVSEENFGKIIDWFDSLDDVFSETRQGIWFVELWKIDEIKNQVYEQFEKYTEKPKYEPPNITRYMTKEMMLEEIQKFGEFVKIGKDVIKEIWLNKQICRKMTKWDILAMYDDCWKVLFFAESKKFAKFAIQSAEWKKVTFPEHPTKRFVMYYSNKLEAHRISYLKKYKYSMNTKTHHSFYENDTCLSLALDKTIEKESVKSRIISMIYEAENRKLENVKRSVFYLGEEEFRAFCKKIKEDFEECMKTENFASEVDSNLEKRREIKRICEIHFPVEEYSCQFRDSLREILKNQENVEELIKVALKARKFYENSYEKVRNFKEFCRKNSERKIVMRIMSEVRIDDQKEWHLFGDEALEAIEVALEKEGKLEGKRDQIEKWRKKWENESTLTTVPVKLFETMVKVVGITNSNFVFVPDVQFYKNMIELPLKMGYNAMKVLSPDGREVYHQVQGQFLIFQFGACDVFWNSEDKKEKNKHKKKVLEEISKIGKGYTLAEIVEQSVQRVMYSDVAQKTPLSALHGKSHNSELSEKELREIHKFFPTYKISNLDACQRKAFFMSRVIESMLMNENGHPELKKNIYKAFSVSFGSVNLKNLEDFEKWFAVGLQGINYIQWDRLKALDSSKIEYCDYGELIEQHYLFDESDPLGTLAQQKKGTRKNKEEDPKVVEKYVENCVNCPNFEKETVELTKKVRNLEKKVEKYEKNMKKKEEDVGKLKSQISQNNQKLREEIQKHTEDVESRESKIEQLYQEIKENREKSRIEREKLHAEVKKSAKKADENEKKMKIELENSKFLEKSRQKELDELKAEISRLKKSLEIAVENREVAEKARENAENRVELLEKQIEEIPHFSEASLEEDFYLDAELPIEPIEEIQQFNVYTILEKISNISDYFGISKSEIVKFQRRYEMYIRILENGNFSEIPEFPNSFSIEFMQMYESCLKGMNNSNIIVLPDPQFMYYPDDFYYYY